MQKRLSRPRYSLAKKSLGQHFLMHARIAERIAIVSGISKNSIVFEIGPGTGVLTRELLSIAKKVIAVEADTELYKKMQDSFIKEIKDGKLELLHGDIQKFDLTTLPKTYIVVANIPYYLTGEIFRMFLSSDNQPRAMTLLVQKEVAERIARAKKQSILSLSVRAYGTPHYDFTVPRGAFRPAPNVDSAVLTIRDISRARFTSPEEERRFFKLIHAGFAHKRKLLRNNLIEAGFSIEGVQPKARAEDMSIETWLLYAQQKNQRLVP